MKNLTSIAEHYDYLEKTFTFDSVKWDLHRKRVEFGKQPLEIWMFTPCKLVDGVWIVLKNPNPIHTYGLEPSDYEYNDSEVLEYQQAKERCLFEGFELKGKYLWLKGYLFMISDDYDESIKNLGNIESLLSKFLIKEIQLTTTALKTLGL